MFVCVKCVKCIEPSSCS
uniref:Uncharacterized protein n=1 Tax=Arundo donax TaxID=35708 RepID=A0A0A8ZPN4_ARUDO